MFFITIIQLSNICMYVCMPSRKDRALNFVNVSNVCVQHACFALASLSMRSENQVPI